MPDLLATLTGALPELGTIGVALVVLTVFRRQQQNDTTQLREQAVADRDYFSAERARIRAEAAEDMQLTRDQAGMQLKELRDELREMKQELREADRERDQLLARLYPQDPATTVLPHRSPYRAGGL